MGTPAAVDPVSPINGSTPAQRLQAVRDSVSKPASDILTLGTERTKFIDALLGTVVLYANLLPIGLATGLTAVAVLIALSVTRRPPFRLASTGWIIGALFLALALAVAISVSGPDGSINGWPQRAARIAATIVFLGVLVSGRIHYPSVVRGAGFGLIFNAAAFYAGYAPAKYGPSLSGFLLDKNQAGMSYALIAVLLLGVLRRRWEHIALIVAASALVWSTGSRTSLAAMACGLIWFFARPFLGRLARTALGTVLAFSLTFVEENYSQVGDFSDRAGSDALRARIDEVSLTKVVDAPWWGQGLGEAWVPLEQGNFFFHNAYWSLLVEGGWPYAIALVAPMVLIGLRPFERGRPASALALSAQAGSIVVLVCALRLGEVFGTTASTLVLAAGCLGYLQMVELRRRTRGLVATQESGQARPE